MPSGAVLGPGQSLSSDNGKYFITMQATDGHLVVYRTADMKVMWANYKPGGVGAWAIFQQDRNFVVYKVGAQTPSNSVWSSQTAQPVWDAGAYLGPMSF